MCGRRAQQPGPRTGRRAPGCWVTMQEMKSLREVRKRVSSPRALLETALIGPRTAADIAVLARAGVLRPLGKAAPELLRMVVREGPKAHLVHALHGIRDAAEPALIWDGGSRTWSEFYDRTKRLANHMLSMGLEPGDAVAIMLPNRPEFIEAQAAALRLGAVTSYVNPRAPAAEAQELFARTRTRLVVTHRPEVTGDIPALVVGSAFDEAIASSSSDDPKVPRSAKGRIVIFTSGTTGRPKAAVRSLAGTGIGSLAGFLRIIPFHVDDVHLVVCPMYHSSGSGFAAVAQALGNPMVVVERFTEEAFCRLVQEHEVTTTTVVPTMLNRLAHFEGARDYDLSSLRIVVCTGSPLRQEVRDAARNLLGDVIFDLYGATEMGWVSIATPDDQRRKPGTVGKPVSNVTLRITDPDGNEVEPGHPGEIWVSSDVLMDSYLDDPELERERIRDGFVSVRDVGYLDDDGYLHVVDRADDMIISGGVNVYPAEVEVALGSHPDVSEAAVVGVNDPEWGQRIVAVVVTDADIAPDALIAWCKEHVSYAAVPKEIRVVDELPRNDIGKVDKRALAEAWDD